MRQVPGGTQTESESELEPEEETDQLRTREGREAELEESHCQTLGRVCSSNGL